ncbi:MAG: MFS transporter [Anaerolineae bacterium]|nr:MFS transporter [Anaerolineae bacterium]
MNRRKTGMLAVLANRSFLALWLGQLISKVGDNLATVAALVLINNLAHAAGSATVIVATALTIPQLFALVGGPLVDRFSRKAIMIITDLLRAGLVLPVLLIKSSDQLYILYICAFLLTTFGSLFLTARNASIPNIVSEEDLLTANALIQATELVSLIVGALLASLIIGLASLATAFVVDSASFILSALLLMAAHIPRRRRVIAPTGTKGVWLKFWHEFKSGVGYIASHKLLLQLMLITMMATWGLSATVLLAAAFFKQLINMPTQYLGLLQAGEGLGMAAGALLISYYASWARSRQIVSVAMIVLGSGILVFALAPQYWMVLIGALIVGMCIVTARTTLAAMTQALVPDSQRGRIESAMVTVIGLGTMGALVMAGILGDIVGPRVILAVTGLIVLAAGITSVFTLRGAEVLIYNGVNGSAHRE